jgi:hypothetical protein
MKTTSRLVSDRLVIFSSAMILAFSGLTAAQESHSANKNDSNALVAFGITLGLPFDEGKVRQIISKKDSKREPFVVEYQVNPLVPNSTFEVYRVYTKYGNVYRVRATSPKKKPCGDDYVSLIITLEGKYGPPKSTTWPPKNIGNQQAVTVWKPSAAEEVKLEFFGANVPKENMNWCLFHIIYTDHDARRKNSELEKRMLLNRKVPAADNRGL